MLAKPFAPAQFVTAVSLMLAHNGRGAMSDLSPLRIKANSTDEPPFSRLSYQTRQQSDESHDLDCLFCAACIPEISVSFALRCPSSGSMHATDRTSTNRRHTTPIPCSFRSCCIPRRVVGALDGVVGHFIFSTLPAPTKSGSLAYSIVLTRR